MLIPTPFYGGFETDLERRAGARCWNVPSTAAGNFQVTRADFEQALAAATHAGVCLGMLRRGGMLRAGMIGRA